LKNEKKKFVLTDWNHLGATHFSTLHHPCLGRDPYFGNRWTKESAVIREKYTLYFKWRLDIWVLIWTKVADLNCPECGTQWWCTNEKCCVWWIPVSLV